MIKNIITCIVIVFALQFINCCSNEKNKKKVESSLNETKTITSSDSTKLLDTTKYFYTQGNKYFITDTCNAFYLNGEESTILFPNTTVSDNQKVFKINNEYYFYFINTLCVLDKSNQIEIFRLPPGKEYYSNRINGLEFIDDTLWIGTQNNGIWLFDVSKKEFTRHIPIYRLDKNEINNNLRMTFDYTSRILWVSSYLRMDMYFRDLDKWTNLNYKYTEYGIDESNKQIIIDGDNVWLIGQETRGPGGGILNYNYKSNKWDAYIKELNGEKDLTFNCYAARNVQVSSDYLWITTSLGNNAYANLRLALLNKKNRKWSYYHPNDFQNLGSILLATENCNRIVILKTLLTILNNYKKFYKSILHSEYYEEYEDYLRGTDTSKIDNSIKVLSNIPIDRDSLCLQDSNEYFTKNNKILYVNENHDLDSLTFTNTPLLYKEVFAEYMDNLIVGTKDAIAIVDIKNKRIRNIFKPLPGYYTNEFVNGSYIINDTVYLIDNTEISDDDYTPSDAKVYIYSIDMREYKLSVEKVPYKFIHKVMDTLKLDKNTYFKINDKKYFIDQEGLKIRTM